jgi:hypothetical protein
MHILLGSPSVVTVDATKLNGSVGSFAEGEGTPVPLGHATPVVSMKYTVFTPLLPLPLVVYTTLL